MTEESEEQRAEFMSSNETVVSDVTLLGISQLVSDTGMLFRAGTSSSTRD